MSRLIVEYAFDPPATDEDFKTHGEKLEPCFEARDVKWIRSFVALDRKRRICIFDAPDAESVRESFRSAGVPVERVWSSEELSPGD